jgi:FdrA protein
VVSTPGRYAFVEAMDALDAGASVMIFSDNVALAQEIALKRTATQRGLLVMGPDCGTSVIGGVGLGFANVVRPGPVGLVAASGTGAQQVMSLLAWAGVGVSHCLGVGGRDLTELVGAVSTHAALDLLDADLATELIVLVAKPAAPSVAAQVREHIERLRTPVVWAVLDPTEPDLTATTETLLGRLGATVPTWPHWPASTPPDGKGGGLRGLYSGGTLCVEALAIAAASLGSISSNLALGPQWMVDEGGGHVLLDLGSDEFTLGRPHPMIDPWTRLERFTAEAADPSCAVLLLDVVLGHGAHPDPAADLAAAVRAAQRTRPDLTVVISLIGTADDPQDLYRQADALSAAGAEVFGSNAQAARFAVAAAIGGQA